MSTRSEREHEASAYPERHIPVGKKSPVGTLRVE